MSGGSALALRIAQASLRHWAARCGYTKSDLVRPAVYMLLLGTLVSATLTLELRSKLPSSPAPAADPTVAAILRGVFLTIFLGSALVVIIIHSSGVEDSRLLAALRPLPITSWLLVASLNLPIAIVLAAGGAIVVPPITVVLMHLGRAPLLPAIAASLLAVASGAALGLVLQSAGKLALGWSRRLKLLAYPATVGAWALATAAEFWWLRNHVGPVSARGQNGVADILLIWPTAAGYALAPSGGRLVELLAVATALALIALLLYRLSLPVGLGQKPIAPVGVGWTSRGLLPLFRLELLRLLRRPRVLASYAATLVLIAGAMIWLMTGGHQDAISSAQFLFLPLSVGLAHIPYIARGYSPRHRPEQLRLGLPPAAWATAVAFAADLVAATLGLALVAGFYAVTGDWQVVMLGAGLLLFILGLAGAVGATVLPGPENSGGEAAGLLGIGIAVGLVTMLAGQVTGGDLRLVALLQAILGVLLLPVPALVETARWVSDTRGPEHVLAFLDPGERR